MKEKTLIEPPYEALKALKTYADEKEMALGSAMDENCIVILMGKRSFTITEVAIVCAFMLLQGILNGQWNSMNDSTNDPESPDRVQ